MDHIVPDGSGGWTLKPPEEQPVEPVELPRRWADIHINRCISCGRELGEMNPRQYCCKTYCPHEPLV